MAKYEKYYPYGRKYKRPWTIHPIWRGIGCILAILIPVMAYAGAVVLLRANATAGWVAVPGELMASVSVPYLGKIPNFYAVALLTILLSFVGFAVLTALYSFIYQIAGPPQYGPLDAPPQHGGRRRGR